MINIIVAHDENLGIGRQNKLLCKLGDDMRMFRMITEGHVVVMGRKTYQSIGKPLLNRMNIILTKKTEVNLDGVINLSVADNIDDILTVSKQYQKEGKEVFIIGGGEIYKQFLPYADAMYITKIHNKFDDVDTFFPNYDLTGWRIISQMQFPKNYRNEYPFTFGLYVR